MGMQLLLFDSVIMQFDVIMTSYYVMKSDYNNLVQITNKLIFQLLISSY